MVFDFQPCLVFGSPPPFPLLFGLVVSCLTVMVMMVSWAGVGVLESFSASTPNIPNVCVCVYECVLTRRFV